jgi:hypothetical protein
MDRLSDDAVVSGGVPPHPVRMAAMGIFLLAALHLDVLWVILDPDARSNVDEALLQSISPSLSSAQLGGARTVMLASMMVTAVVVALLLVWLGVKTRYGRRWARVVVTVIVTVEMLGRLRAQLEPGAPSALTAQLLTLIDLLVRVGVLALLWAPEDSRLYFHQHTRTS